MLCVKMANVFLGMFGCCQSDDDPQEDLANSSYKLDIKYKASINHHIQYGKI